MVIVAVGVSAPFAMTFVAGSIVVTSSTLSASVYFYPPMPQSNQTILITWILDHNSGTHALSTSSPAYKITLNGIELPYTDHSQPPVLDSRGNPVGCDVAVPSVN